MPPWIEAMFETALKQEAEGHRPHALDTLMRQIDLILRQGKMEECDQMLDAVDVTRFSTTLLLTFLMITAAARPHLKRRDDLYRRVHEHLATDPNRDKLLSGLK